jgi:hypothetical protein
MARASVARAAATGLVDETLLNRSDERAIQALLWALKPLANLRGSVPLSAVTTFLMVALDEGKGVNAYARAMGIHRSAMSRCLHDIGGRARSGGPGLGLVSIDPHPTVSQRSQVRLTAKGRSIAQEVFRQVRKAAGPDHLGIDRDQAHRITQRIELRSE